MTTIRPERPEDIAAARRIHEEAFAPATGEADLVDLLREAGDHVPELCLAAFDGDELVGHIVYSRATLASGHDVLALAPMAVTPRRQQRGIGSQLVRASLDRAAATDAPLVVVLGHAGYYPRFGFEPAGAHGVEAPWEVPPEAWMIHKLPAYTPGARGLVTYAPAFDAVT